VCWQDESIVRSVLKSLEALVERRGVLLDVGIFNAGFDAKFDAADALVEERVARNQCRSLDIERDASFAVSRRVDDLDIEAADRDSLSTSQSILG
jgi:hypothetical protein